ncbi:MAG: hypothetical protein HY234_03645 [Acidobacteria bacterium]|nr:hypothetical protein [Acidobacteriota bacterium]MBI3662130.1 hypothetical protein [Acidobacteriota bacterium]
MLKPTTDAVPLRSHDFRLLVVQKLTLLETMMIELAGNGQPGRIQRLEDKVRAHDRLFWLMTGAGVVVGWLLQRIFA